MRMSDEPLLSAQVIARRIKELGREMALNYAGRNPLMLGVLKGATLFAADLARAMPVDLELDFIQARSYTGMQSAGRVALSRAEDLGVRGRHVIVVEDIVDTGRTASTIMERLRGLDPATLALCAMLDKPCHRVVEFQPDYVGFTIDDHFVVGYGLDHDQRYRNLPDIRILLP